MPLTIKRYPNRKLYDTSAKHYVTLDAIATLIQQGQDVAVIDYETGEDLTSVTLMQIIVEQEKKKTGFLPQAVLQNLIRTGGDTLEYLRRSIASSWGAAKLLEGEIDRRLDTLVERGELKPDDAEHLRTELLAQASLSNNESTNEVPASEPRAHEQENPVETALHRLMVPSRADVIRLERQLEALSSKLDALLEKEAQVETARGRGRPSHPRSRNASHSPEHE